MENIYENFKLPIYLFKEGKNYESYKLFGSHQITYDGIEGFRFVVWAPHGKKIELVGDFNSWNGYSYQMKEIDNSGIWFIFIPGFPNDSLYKYKIFTNDGRILYKADPYGFYSEKSPGTATRSYEKSLYNWADSSWLKKRNSSNIYNSSINIYELHLGSWKSSNIYKAYPQFKDLAIEIVDYVKSMGYTHIEIMPIMEHPFDGSWGYQITGYYSVTSRYGSPEDFKFFVNHCHKNKIGIILDWVPCHFCRDEHGLFEFDGSPLYESDNLEKSDNYLWGTRHFDFSKPEIYSFLISNAFYWIEEFHLDGLRVDAVAYMIYENLNESTTTINNDSVNFLKNLNTVMFSKFPNILMIAEESSAYPLVTAPIHDGGLGFNFKWNMGWMNDVLKYMEKDFNDRKWFHNLITFSFTYSFSENFILPLSHDEVVHGKKSLLDKMPGTYEEKFSNLRLLYTYMIAHPGKKLMFMGGEFGQFIEWKYDDELDWFLLEYEMHKKLQYFFKILNSIYIQEKPLYEIDSSSDTFNWINGSNNENSIIIFIRNGKKDTDKIIVILNFGSTYFDNYSFGLPLNGEYKLLLNSDNISFGGINYDVKDTIISKKIPRDGFANSGSVKLPPFSGLYYKYKKKYIHNSKF